MVKIEYKGYRTEIKYYPDDEEYAGKIEDIEDLVCFSETTPEKARKAFEEIVEDYISLKKLLTPESISDRIDAFRKAINEEKIKAQKGKE